MALQIIERRWCDGLKQGDPGDFVERHEPETVKGTTRTFALDSAKPRNVDLCDWCNGGLTLDELRAVIREFGMVVESAGRNPKPTGGGKPALPTLQRDGRTLCIWCPGDYSWGAWGGHIRTAHGFAGVREALGKMCPACGEEFPGLSVHITRGHDEFAMVTDAFFWARDNSDPYGVWAKVSAAAPRLDSAPDEVDVLL